MANIRPATAGRRLSGTAAAGGVRFDVAILVDGASGNTVAAIKGKAMALQAADIKAEFEKQVVAVKDSADFSDVADDFVLPANVFALSGDKATTAVVTAAPTPVPFTSGKFDFQKQLDAAGLMTLAWRVNPGNAPSVTVRLSCARTTYLAFGLNTVGKMPGTYSVIASSSEAGSTWYVAEYNINSKDGSGIVAQPAAKQSLRDVSVEQADGMTTLYFTRDAVSVDADDMAFTLGLDGPGDTVVWAFGNDGDSTLHYHGASNSGTAGASVVNWGNGVTEEASVLGLNHEAVLAHGIAMLLAWGLCVPSGILVARFYKHLGQFWFMVHRALQSISVLLTMFAFYIIVDAVEKAKGSHFEGTDSHHKKLGLVITILTVLQPLNAFVRPHATAKGENKPCLRALWEWIHKGVGWALLLAGLVNVFTGLELEIMQHGKLAKIRWQLLPLAGMFVVQVSGAAALSLYRAMQRTKTMEELFVHGRLRGESFVGIEMPEKPSNTDVSKKPSNTDVSKKPSNTDVSENPLTQGPWRPKEPKSDSRRSRASRRPPVPAMPPPPTPTPALAQDDIGHTGRSAADAVDMDLI